MRLRTTNDKVCKESSEFGQHVLNYGPDRGGKKVANRVKTGRRLNGSRAETRTEKSLRALRTQNGLQS